MARHLMVAALSVGCSAGLPWGALCSDAFEGGGPKAFGERFAVAMDSAYAWCDHMPGTMLRRRQYLSLRVTLTNETDSPLRLELHQVLLSFDKGQRGSGVTGLLFVTGDGPRGDTVIMLAPREKRMVGLRGEKLFEEGMHGRDLFVTLVLEGGAETLAVRSSARVVATS